MILYKKQSTTALTFNKGLHLEEKMKLGKQNISFKPISTESSTVWEVQSFKHIMLWLKSRESFTVKKQEWYLFSIFIIMTFLAHHSLGKKTKPKKKKSAHFLWEKKELTLPYLLNLFWLPHLHINPGPVSPNPKEQLMSQETLHSYTFHKMQHLCRRERLELMFPLSHNSVIIHSFWQLANQKLMHPGQQVSGNVAPDYPHLLPTGTDLGWLKRGFGEEKTCSYPQIPEHIVQTYICSPYWQCLLYGRSW